MNQINITTYIKCRLAENDIFPIDKYIDIVLNGTYENRQNLCKSLLKDKRTKYFTKQNKNEIFIYFEISNIHSCPDNYDKANDKLAKAMRTYFQNNGYKIMKSEIRNDHLKLEPGQCIVSFGKWPCCAIHIMLLPLDNSVIQI